MDVSYTLHRERPLLLHGYLLPFAALYGVIGGYWLSLAEHEQEGGTFGSIDILLISFIVVALFNAICYFATFWNVTFNAWMTMSSLKDPREATLIKVHPRENRGSSEICKLHHETNQAGSETKEVLWFSFQRKLYFYNFEEKDFKHVEYPVSETFEFYSNSLGYHSAEAEKLATQKWGLNSLEIPLPTFKDLFKEHAVAPFFIFQLFCVLLWCLDEYWYYSIFTLFMLLVFEATVVFQRLRNMKELRNMAPKQYDISVYRNKTWKTVKTDALLPGDIVSIVRSKDDASVPCDILLLNGSCIVNEAMLTGESTPQLKEPITGRKQTDNLNMNVDKLHIVFSGTKVVQNVASEESADLKAPDGGCTGYVLKTGFETSQGELVRTILFSTERVTANNKESLFFILFLMIFAIAASSYVWNQGIKRGKSRYQLLLDCILIITSVIPPELPMELSLAVNQSIIALFKFAIFCTEPFRIPFAGKIDICCFDKTGTLTTEELVLKGVTGLNDMKQDEIAPPTNLPELTTFILATCHSLMQLDDGLVGDPMEKAALEGIGWTFTKGNVAQSKKDRKEALKVLRRFQFSSALKRMATISRFEGEAEGNVFVAVKGAPETLHDMFIKCPSYYSTVHKEFARTGSRVLALGYKKMSVKPKEINTIDREVIESNLIFAGFLIFSSPLKPDAASALTALRNASHRNVMITGDNPLTACHIAKEVSIIEKTSIILDAKEEFEFPKKPEELEWRSVDETVVLPFEAQKEPVKKILDKFDVCITGRAFDIIKQTSVFGLLLPQIRVYARTSPDQKENIITSMKKMGFSTLMCGDGTNDVGALKQADVGIALLNGTPEDLAKIAKARAQVMERKRQEKMAEMKRRIEEARNPDATLTPAQRAERTRQNTLAAAQAAMNDIEDDVPIIKLGDASIAAPFTSKISQVTSVNHIIRQGRSALVTTIQMYKILALNCLITAYSLSVLYLDGIKFGDMQMTVSGILLSVCFLAISKNTTLDQLSKKRPQPNIFNFYILLSVIGQFAIHVYSLYTITSLAKELMDIKEDEVVDLEKKFEPSLLNGGVYLISLAMHVSTFAINYQGRPFREGITENRPLFYSLMMVMMICFAAASDSSDQIRSTMELVPFPDEFRETLQRLIFIDLVGSWAVEKVTSYLFSDNRPKRILGLD